MWARSRPEPRLRELSFGEWQGLTYQEIGERDPEALAAWNRDRVNCRPPGGESLGAMAARVRDLLDDVHRDTRDGTVALVSHGGTIRIILCVLLGHPWPTIGSSRSITLPLPRSRSAARSRRRALERRASPQGATSAGRLLASPHPALIDGALRHHGFRHPNASLTLHASIQAPQAKQSA